MVVEAEFDDGMILRRVVHPSLRSRSFIDEEPVTSADLTRIAARIIDIHAQHKHLLLSDPAFQMEVLDRYAGSMALLEQYREQHRRFLSLSREADSLREQASKLNADSDYRNFQLSQLEEANLCEGELAALEQEQKALAHAEDIKEGLMRALELLGGNEENMGLVQGLKEAASSLGKSAGYVESAASLAERLQSCRIEIDDIESELAALSDRIVVSPERLAQVDDRLALLYSLLKKHRCADEAGLIAYRDSLREQCGGSEELSVRIEALAAEAAAADKARRELAEKIRQRRESVVEPLCAMLEEQIRSLELPRAVFRVELSALETLGESGGDALRFLFSANGEQYLADISKVASGGELSRVMLALKAVMARFTSLPTMIFDEIDTGVSGRAADRMGEMVSAMAANMQIFSITHLPQIASKKGAHFLVYKETDAQGRTVSRIRRLSDEERVLEVARMLSGAKLTDAAIRNAKELLK